MGVRCVSVFLEPVRIWVTFLFLSGGRLSSGQGGGVGHYVGHAHIGRWGTRLWSLYDFIRSLEFRRISYLCRGVRTIAWVRRNRNEIMWRWPIVLIGLHETRMTYSEVGCLLGFLLKMHWRMPTSFFNVGPSLSPSRRIVSEGAYAKGIRLSGMMAYK